MSTPPAATGRHRRRRWAAAAGAALLILVSVQILDVWRESGRPTSDPPAATIEGALPAIPAGERHVLLLLMIDGLAVDAFERAVAERRTPLVINGPGVVPGEETHAPRLVDLYPSVAVLLGASPDDPAFGKLDGRVLDCVRRGTGK